MSEYRKFEAELKRDMAKFGKEWAEELQSARELILQRKRLREENAKNVKVPSVNEHESGVEGNGHEVEVLILDEQVFKELKRSVSRRGGRRLRSDTGFMLYGHSVKDLEPRPFVHSPFWCKEHDRWFSECVE